MVLEVCHLEGSQFPMATNVHRHFRQMGDRTHSARFSVREVNLSGAFCFDRLDPVVIADFSVDEVFSCS